MDEFVYNGLMAYYKALGKLGYYKYPDVFGLLVLGFYWDFLFKDYRGLLSREDYHEIEKALNCLFGTSCLIPYPDYLKMGKLHIGEITEMAQRLSTLEDTEVLKAKDLEGQLEDSDIIIMAEDDNND